MKEEYELYPRSMEMEGRKPARLFAFRRKCG